MSGKLNAALQTPEERVAQLEAVRKPDVMSTGTSTAHLGTHPCLTFCGRSGWVANSAQLPYLTEPCKTCQREATPTKDISEPETGGEQDG